MMKDRIERLKQNMIKEGIDVYFFNTSDYHLSEYVPEYFRTIAYFSGFTGSMASLLVCRDRTCIFVDGRYHTQADNQCLEHGIEVIKLGTKDAPEPLEFLKQYYPKATVGLDGRRTSCRFVKELLDNDIKVKSIDIYSELIENRAPLSRNPIYEMEEKYVGLSRKRKIEAVNNCIRDKVHVVNNLESIAWLLNLRSDDILYTPVFLSYLVVMDKDVYLFCDLERFSEEILDGLYADGVIIRPYDSFYEFLGTIRNRKILVDENKVNYDTYKAIDRNGNTVLNMRSIIEDLKSVKNPVEQENFRLAHIYDGVSLVRVLMWLDSIDKSTVDECDVSRKIDELRLANGASTLSFSSIVGYNENAAIIHYFPEEGKCARLDNKGILLFDTGGQYYYGTTDITRTVALGPVDDEVKKYFTLERRCMLNLSELKFLQGLSGNQIDIIARKELWKHHVDYRHGTGHGVGYYLSVHEGPPNIRYGKTELGTEKVEIKPGMVFSDEPGIYFEGKFGIRCENLVMCMKDEENEYGQFLRFDTLTMVPFDLDLIDMEYMDQESIDALNRYHEKVYENLSPFMNEEEKEYLRKLTRKI